MRVSGYNPGSERARRAARTVGAALGPGLISLFMGAPGSAEAELRYRLSGPGGDAVAEGTVKASSGTDKPEVGFDRAVATVLQAVNSSLREGR